MHFQISEAQVTQRRNSILIITEALIKGAALKTRDPEAIIIINLISVTNHGKVSVRGAGACLRNSPGSLGLARVALQVPGAGSQQHQHQLRYGDSRETC